MTAIIVRILRQIRNDFRSLALLIIAPIFILTLLYFLLGDSGYIPKIDAYGLPDAYVNTLSESLTVTSIDQLPAEPYTYITEHKIDGVITADTSGITLYLIENNSKTALVQKALSQMVKGGVESNIMYQYETSSDNQLDSLAYVFLGVLAFFFVFIFSGVSFVGERSQQTLDRMLLSPLSKTSIILGYLIGYGILSGVQSTIMILFAKYVLHLSFSGSVLTCILIMVLLSFCAVACGTLLSIFAQNQFQMIQFIPIIIVPQIFFSGLIPIDTIPYGIGRLCYIFPVYYGCHALKDVMVYGYSIMDISFYIIGLVIFTTVLFAANIVALKQEGAS